MNHRLHLVCSIFSIIALSLAVNACSKNTGQGTTSTINNKNTVLHTHLANKCIDAVSHAHPNGKKEHLHHYHTCESTGVKSNAHSHPSSSISGFTRHVHPNGINEHTHLR